MTVPLTRDISDFAYEIDYELTGEFVCCTLNGLLWLYENENNFNLIALKWNEETQKLEFAQSKTINKESVRARGIDWILLRNSFILISNNQIKINTLLDTTEEKFLYSVLRAYQKWGSTDGYFSTNYEGLYPVGTHQMEFCYSVLPAVGDYQIIEDFLICRNSGTPQLYPLIPLEFNYNAEPTYGTDYGAENRGIQLAIINGELWGRGTKNIGKVSILPAVFDENGNPEEFYLYISPEYRQQSLSNDLTITGTEKPVGFLSEQVNSVTNGTCINSTSEEFLNVENNEWINPRPDDNKQTTFDLTTGQGISLGENGITLIQNKRKSYQCRNLSKWVAPADKIESISDKKIISSSDNFVIRTDIDTGFNRDFINGNGTFSQSEEIFVGEKNKKLHVVNFDNKNNLENISFDRLFKNFLKIKLIKILKAELYSWGTSYSISGEKQLCYSSPVFIKESNISGWIANMGLYIFDHISNSLKEYQFSVDMTEALERVHEEATKRFFSYDYTVIHFDDTGGYAGGIGPHNLYIQIRGNKIVFSYYAWARVCGSVIRHHEGWEDHYSTWTQWGENIEVELYTLPDEIANSNISFNFGVKFINSKIIENSYMLYFQGIETKTIFTAKNLNMEYFNKIYRMEIDTNKNLFLFMDTGYSGGRPQNNIYIYQVDFDPSIFDFQAEYERSK